MEKSLVFISHISEESEIAQDLKELIEESFLGMIEVFVSSDGDSISVGQKWLENITNSLKECSVEIILCSDKSIQRPWINFEAGAGWIKEIPVIPICHSGMNPSKLPVPLNMLQATSLSEVSGLKLLFTVLAGEIGAQNPKVDFTEFIVKVKDFEERYSFWDNCNEYFIKLNEYNPQILKLLTQQGGVKIDIPERKVEFMEHLMSFFERNQIMKMQSSGGTKIGPGIVHEYIISTGSMFSEIISDPHYVYNGEIK